LLVGVIAVAVVFWKVGNNAKEAQRKAEVEQRWEDAKEFTEEKYRQNPHWKTK